MATTGTMVRNALGRGLVALGLWLGVATASQATETVVYYHTDALGSPVAVTDAGGAVIEYRTYEPYGKQLSPLPPQDGPGYTGHVYDAATGLNYMQQRYYDPAIGRFLSVDPVSATSVGGNFNRYWYANNNPYKFTDPDGRYVCKAGPEDCGTIDQAMADNRTAEANAQAGSIEQQTLARTNEAYGQAWEENGVEIQVDHDPSSAGADTVTVDGITTVTFHLGPTKSDAPTRIELASWTAHEGNHVVDQQRFGMPTSLAQDISTESRAYTTGAMIYKIFNQDEPSGMWTRSGGYDPNAIANRMWGSVIDWCQGNPQCK